MKLERNKPGKLVRVQVLDGETRRGKNMTIYDATPEQVIDVLRAAVKSASKNGKGKR
jgi:hypothetical protein